MASQAPINPGSRVQVPSEKVCVVSHQASGMRTTKNPVQVKATGTSVSPAPLRAWVKMMQQAKGAWQTPQGEAPARRPR